METALSSIPSLLTLASLRYELTKMENQYAKNGEKNVDGMNECGTQEIKANTETFRFISLFFNVATTSSLLFLSTNEFEQSSFNSTEIIDSMLKVVKKTNSFFFFRIVRGGNLSTWRFFDQCELWRISQSKCLTWIKTKKRTNARITYNLGAFSFAFSFVGWEKFRFDFLSRNYVQWILFINFEIGSDSSLPFPSANNRRTMHKIKTESISTRVEDRNWVLLLIFLAYPWDVELVLCFYI